MSLIGASPGVLPPNNPPEWVTTPVIVLAPGVGGTHDLKINVFDPEDDVLTFAKITGTFESWMSLDSGGVLTFTTGAVEGVFTGFSFSADDGTASPVTSATFSITVTDVTAWPAQDAWAGVVPAVRNRNGSGVVSAGRGRGMDGRHAYSLWNVSAQTGTTPVILHVTNLNATGAGSLHEHLVQTSGPRIIVFDISGRIDGDPASWNINDGRFWIACQSAPGPFMLNKLRRFIVKDGDYFIQHFSIWHSGSFAAGSNDNAFSTFGTGPVFNNAVIDHCSFGGGVDQCLLVFADLVGATFVDTIIHEPRGNATDSTVHNYGGNIAGNSTNEDATNIDMVGCCFAFCEDRMPGIRAENFNVISHLVYDRGFAGFWISGKDSAITHNANIIGVFQKRGSDHSGSTKAIAFKDASRKWATDSKLHISGVVDSGQSGTDPWDFVSDEGSQESDVRENTAVVAALPVGLVAPDFDSLTEAEITTLCTQNLAPFPNNRAAFMTTLVAKIVDGTGSIANDYSVPTLSSTTSVFVPVANPHEESSTDPGRTNLEVQLLDLSEGLLN